MAKKLPSSGYILALDVGEKRIGTALASVIARLPQPLRDVAAGETSYKEIADLIEKEEVELVVVGIPRNLSGEETAQSRIIRQFAGELSRKISVPIDFADESLSSARADDLAKNLEFKNASRDSLAACFILEEFLGTIDSRQGEQNEF